MAIQTSNNYRVSGQKMTSRFGESHKQMRAHAKYVAQHWSEGKSPRMLSKRLAKKCTHPRMQDHGYGGPESGCIDLHCPDCGYGHHVTLY